MKQTEKKRQLKEKEQGPARLCYCCSAAVLQAAAVQYQPATNADHTETEAKQQHQPEVALPMKLRITCYLLEH